jgi:hypothetical protein
MEFSLPPPSWGYRKARNEINLFGKKWREARKRVNRVGGGDGVGGKLKTIIKAFPRQETKEKVKIN